MPRWVAQEPIIIRLPIHQLHLFIHFLTQFFVSSHMYPENPEGTQVIVGSMNMGYYISDTARNRTHNLFRPKREPIPLGHSDLFRSLEVDTSRSCSDCELSTNIDVFFRWLSAFRRPLRCRPIWCRPTSWYCIVPHKPGSWLSSVHLKTNINKDEYTQNSICGKTRGGQQCMFYLFWLFFRGQYKLGGWEALEGGLNSRLPTPTNLALTLLFYAN